MRYQCPSCHGVLYDRKRKTCVFCGTVLPEELLFTPAQLKDLRREAEAAEQRRVQREKEAAQERARHELWDPSYPGEV
jgi:hypothetical protein